jgi:hypothetical protein
VQTEERIAELEKELAAAKELAAQGEPPKAAGQDGPPEPDTSQMPGGVDSAPVSEAELKAPLTPETAATYAPASAALAVERAAETDGLDILDKLKEGHTVKWIADRLDSPDLDSAHRLESIVRAISDLAQGVRI